MKVQLFVITVFTLRDGLCSDAESSLQNADLTMKSSQESLSMVRAAVPCSACDTGWRVHMRQAKQPKQTEGRFKGIL